MSDETDRHAKAYALWEKEGHPEGRHLDHWNAAGNETNNNQSSEQTPDRSATEASEDPEAGSEAIVDHELSKEKKSAGSLAGRRYLLFTPAESIADWHVLRPWNITTPLKFTRGRFEDAKAEAMSVIDSQRRADREKTERLKAQRLQCAREQENRRI